LQVLCDAISIVMTVSVVLMVNLNVAGLFGHDLLLHHPHLCTILLIMVGGYSSASSSTSTSGSSSSGGGSSQGLLVNCKQQAGEPCTQQRFDAV
jgi:uncharacterized membrane protein YgcG